MGIYRKVENIGPSVGSLRGKPDRCSARIMLRPVEVRTIVGQGGRAHAAVLTQDCCELVPVVYAVIIYQF